MPAITATNMAVAGETALTYVTLDGSTDTFTYNSNANPVLVLENSTGGPLVPVITGDAASSSVNVPGVPGGFDASVGYTLASIADGTSVAIRLNSIAAYLPGTISITSGTGLTAALMEF